MQNKESVILLHGLCRSHYSFNKLATVLRSKDYHVINVSYPSRKHPIETLVRRYLDEAINTCLSQGVSRIHFVSHSMGAILVRYYLKHTQLNKLGHVVMLSPPNQGSELVDKLGQLSLFKFLNGPAGQQLGTSTKSLPVQLGEVTYPVGVITGNRSINPLLSLLIPGTNDGKVSVARAKVVGMADFLEVSQTHPMILRNRYVINETLHFLKHGTFNHSCE